VGGGLPGLVTQCPLASRVGSRSAYRVGIGGNKSLAEDPAVATVAVEQEVVVAPAEQWH
jgi:hypothetical protein